ncbi:MAG: GNAT family N-acetyltransferase [Oscillospiraceae bacterium]|nr:GNAT family N-acetyltransferase [Oscillospiraceae bacterium]
MNIEYHQLRIRNAEKKDCVQLAKWWNNGKVMAHAGFPNGLGISAAEIENQIADDSNNTKRRLVIEYQNTLIGEMSFYVYKNARYEIGIKICEAEYQDKGFGKILLSMLIEELFNMGAETIFLDTNLNNTRAQHVYEKLGFRKIGIRYDAWRNQLGELQSCVDYELTKHDFCNWMNR